MSDSGIRLAVLSCSTWRLGKCTITASVTSGPTVDNNHQYYVRLNGPEKSHKSQAPTSLSSIQTTKGQTPVSRLLRGSAQTRDFRRRVTPSLENILSNSRR